MERIKPYQVLMLFGPQLSHKDANIPLLVIYFTSLHQRNIFEFSEINFLKYTPFTIVSSEITGEIIGHQCIATLTLGSRFPGYSRAPRLPGRSRESCSTLRSPSPAFSILTRSTDRPGRSSVTPGPHHTGLSLGA